MLVNQQALARVNAAGEVAYLPQAKKVSGIAYVSYTSEFIQPAGIAYADLKSWLT
jgi:hypothetical protein